MKTKRPIGIPHPETTKATGQERPPLDQLQVVQAALDLLDEVGLDGLSMRQLAERLGIKAASLYWHVRDKEALLSLVADELCARMPTPDPATTWREQLIQLAIYLRGILQSHRDAALVMVSTMPTGPNRLRLIELVLQTLLKSGLDPKEAAYASFLLNDYVTSFMVEENRTASVALSQKVSIEAINDQVRQWFTALPPDEFPALSATAAYLTEADTEQRFWFGVEIILDGLARQIEKSSPRHQEY